jgi:hypothetical protein
MLDWRCCWLNVDSWGAALDSDETQQENILRAGLEPVLISNKRVVNEAKANERGLRRSMYERLLVRDTSFCQIIFVYNVSIIKKLAFPGLLCCLATLAPTLAALIDSKNRWYNEGYESVPFKPKWWGAVF